MEDSNELDDMSSLLHNSVAGWSTHWTNFEVYNNYEIKAKAYVVKMDFI